jgi:hypothetical protein
MTGGRRLLVDIVKIHVTMNAECDQGREREKHRKQIDKSPEPLKDAR